MLFRSFPSPNYSLLPQGQLLVLPKAARRETEEVPGRTTCCWLIQQGSRYGRTKTSCSPVWNWFGWREVSCPGIWSGGFSCQTHTGCTPTFQSAPSVSCMFSLLQCGFCLQICLLELVLRNCSTATGCFHMNTLGVAKEESHNKHIEGKNSGKQQVNKILLPFPGASVGRTLLSSSIIGQNVLIFGWGRVKTQHPHTITPRHWQLGLTEP